MNIAIFGATGSVGAECLKQAIVAGHTISILVRDKTKLVLPANSAVRVVEGNGLNIQDVRQAITAHSDAVLFAVGMTKDSPKDLCTDITSNIVEVMQTCGVRRFIFCGGASTLIPEDQIDFGMRFVEFFAKHFMANKHYDKERQLALLRQTNAIDWLGIRPVQIVNGPRRGSYRLGYISFNGFSKISFADCAQEMLHMLADNTWLKKLPIIRY